MTVITEVEDKDLKALITHMLKDSENNMIQIIREVEDILKINGNSREEKYNI